MCHGPILPDTGSCERSSAVCGWYSVWYTVGCTRSPAKVCTKTRPSETRTIKKKRRRPLPTHSEECIVICYGEAKNSLPRLQRSLRTEMCLSLKPTPSTDTLPKGFGFAFEQTIELIKKYKLPCDVVIDSLPPGTLAVHRGWSNGIGRIDRCEIVLSLRLVGKSDKKSIRRRIIHECAHHIAGLQAGHGPTFMQVASRYEAEGFPRGRRGEGWGDL
jgi:hypothetical protein